MIARPTLEALKNLDRTDGVTARRLRFELTQTGEPPWHDDTTFAMSFGADRSTARRSCSDFCCSARPSSRDFSSAGPLDDPRWIHKFAIGLQRSDSLMNQVFLFFAEVLACKHASGTQRGVVLMLPESLFRRFAFHCAPASSHDARRTCKTRPAHLAQQSTNTHLSAEPLTSEGSLGTKLNH